MQTLRHLFSKSRIENKRDVEHGRLIGAAEFGNFNRIESLLSEGANVNFCNLDGETALHKAATYNNAQCLWLLILSGADVNVENCKGETPLAQAAYYNSVMCVHLLIKGGADVNSTSYIKQFTPLFNATFKGNKECIKMLLKAGADVNISDIDGNTPLLCTVYNGLWRETTLLLDTGADVNACDNSGYTALTTAVSSNNIQCVRILLKSGAYVNKYNINQQNALIFYVTECQTIKKEMVMLLVAAGEMLNLDTFRLHTSSKMKLEMKAAVKVSIPDYFHHAQLKLSLKHACRETIRNHLLQVQTHYNLFRRVPRLGLPSSLTSYVLYGQSVNVGNSDNNDDDEDEDDSDGCQINKKEGRQDHNREFRTKSSCHICQFRQSLQGYSKHKCVKF